MGRQASALAFALFIAGCAAQPVALQRTATPGVVVVPTVLPNGRVEIAVRPHYVLGAGTRIDVAFVATRGSITGPTEARVMASGINEGGAPAEVLVRRLAVSVATATADRRATTSVTWNGEDEFGVRDAWEFEDVATLGEVRHEWRLRTHHCIRRDRVHKRL